MGILKSQSLGTHLLIAAGLFVGVIAVAVGTNWSTFVVMYENLAAMNEGQQVAEQLRAPTDLVDYISAHPERVSLVAYEVGAREEGIFFGADRPRTVVQTPSLLLLAEYGRRVEQGELRPSDRVPIDSIGMYALPGAGQSRHQQARSQWEREDLIAGDSTVALRRVVEAMIGYGDPGATDWLMTRLGRETVQVLPARWGLPSSDPPLPNSGVYLHWGERPNGEEIPSLPDSLRTDSRSAHTDHVYEHLRAFRRDSAYRHRLRHRLDREGLGLSVRDQHRMARRTYPSGTARDYADLVARITDGRIGGRRLVQTIRDHLESDVGADSIRAPISSLGTHVGAMPGLISFVGFARSNSDESTRVSALFFEDLPIGLFYHIVQTGLDKGLQLRLLSDPEFFDEVRTTLSRETTTGDSEE